MRIEKSLCDGFVRIIVGSTVHIVTISEWSRAVGHPGEFMISPVDKLKAQGETR